MAEAAYFVEKPVAEAAYSVERPVAEAAVVGLVAVDTG